MAVPARRGLVARFARDQLALIGLVLLVAFVSAALAAPVLTPYDPAAQDPTRRLLLPSLQHPLGTDNLGRDLLSRLLFGSRWSLGTAALATLLIMTIGVAVGAVAGYYGGLLDDLVVLVVDVRHAASSTTSRASQSVAWVPREMSLRQCCSWHRRCPITSPVRSSTWTAAF